MGGFATVFISNQPISRTTAPRKTKISAEWGEKSDEREGFLRLVLNYRPVTELQTHKRQHNKPSVSFSESQIWRFDVFVNKYSTIKWISELCVEDYFPLNVLVQHQLLLLHQQEKVLQYLLFPSPQRSISSAANSYCYHQIHVYVTYKNHFNVYKMY